MEFFDVFGEAYPLSPLSSSQNTRMQLSGTFMDNSDIISLEASAEELPAQDEQVALQFSGSDMINSEES